MERQNILTAGRRNCSRKVVPVSGRRACRGPTSVRRREETVATSAWPRRSFMDLRFDLSSGRPVAADLVAAGLGGGEPPAARQQCLTKQGSSDPGTQPKADLALGWRLGLLFWFTELGARLHLGNRSHLSKP